MIAGLQKPARMQRSMLALFLPLDAMLLLNYHCLRVEPRPKTNLLTVYRLRFGSTRATNLFLSKHRARQLVKQ